MGWIPNLNCLAGFPPFPPSNLRINLIHAWWPSLARLPGFIKVGSGGVWGWCIGVLFQWLVDIFTNKIYETLTTRVLIAHAYQQDVFVFVAPGVLHSNRESHPRHWPRRFFFSGMDISVAALPCREDAALFLHDARIWGPDDMMRRCIKWTQWWIEGLRKRRQAWKKEADGGKGFKIKYYKGGSWKKHMEKQQGIVLRDMNHEEPWRTSKWKLLHNYKSWIYSYQQTHDIFAVPSGLGTSTSKEAKAFLV